MRLSNPLTFEYPHANFGANKIKTSLNDGGDSALRLEVTAPDGRSGEAQVQMQDSGNVVLRVQLDPANPIHVLIVDGSGTLFEQ